MALRSIELFAGGGGLALGLERVGARTVCFVERDAFAAACLVAAMERGDLAAAPVWSDVCTFDGGRWRGRVDLVAGGFPCQDISLAGKGAGIIEGERSGLWREFARIVREVRPRYVFVENVSALLVRGLDVVLADLAALGFDAEWGCFRASDVGAPHRRERIFVLAHPGCRGVERRAGPSDVSGPPPPPATEAPLSDAADERRERNGSARGGRAGSADCGCWDPDAWHRRYGLAPGEVCSNAGRRSDDRGVLGDPHRRGLEGGGVEERGRVEGAPRGEPVGSGSHGRLPWPPGPDDAAGWRAYLARWPGAEPAVRRGADGLAGRVDRLRVLGNGVVPDQAALAWRVLWERLHA